MTLDPDAPRPVPARVAPIFLPRIWGTRDLSSMFPDRSPEHEPIGEVWLTGDACRFDTGPFAGRTLGEVWSILPEAWTGRNLSGLSRVPLLVKFIFPEDKLSVQVHPDDAYAHAHETASGGIGKTEMWYVVSAREGTEMRVGLRAEVTRESFMRAVTNGTVEECLELVAVRAGDAVFVPAGTAHTIGPGVILCEIQQQSDITYRLYDYGRVGRDGNPRPLHIRQALEVMQFGAQSGGRCVPVRVTRGAMRQTYFIACRHFAAERWEFQERISAATSSEHFDVLIFLSGNGHIESEAGIEEYKPAELWLLPATLGDYHLQPKSPTTMLRAYVPNLQEFTRHLADEHVDESLWEQVLRP